MSLVTINTNLTALQSQRSLGQYNAKMIRSMERLTSGLRVNSAKDDAAGLAISDRMTAQIRSLYMAVRNANDGISLTQTADGALQETTNILQRMRELAVQSANDTNTSADRASLDVEMTQLRTELGRIASTTKFNGKTLLNGDFTSTAAVFQIGADAGETINVTIGEATTSVLGIDSITISSNSAASNAISIIDSAISSVDSNRSNLGAMQNRFESTIANLMNVAEKLSAARSQILDANVAEETSEMLRNNIRQQAGTAMLSQANQAPQMALSLLQF